ncbi:MAG: YafY family transcriptional regulator [Clostridium sp.]|nr:YafY family transcriptional regulator [Clostridium sp.]
MKLDRLIGILTVLLQHDKTTAPELAKRFGVSRRTILRDIDALDLAGIPIVTSRGGDGGISIMDGYKIKMNVLTTDELQTLMAGLKCVDSVSNTSHFEQLMTKLAPNGAAVSLASSVVIDLSSHYKDSIADKINIFKQAIAERKTVAFDYYYPKGEMPREIEPYVVEFRWSSWYIFGFCRLRQEFRRFKLNRLWNYHVTDQPYELRPIPHDQEDAGYDFPDPYNAKILFDKSVRFRLIDEYGPHCYEEREDGLLLSLDYTNREFIFSWILSFGDKAKVIEPQEAVERFSEMAKKLFELYKRT